MFAQQRNYHRAELGLPPKNDGGAGGEMGVGADMYDEGGPLPAKGRGSRGGGRGSRGGVGRGKGAAAARAAQVRHITIVVHLAAAALSRFCSGLDKLLLGVLFIF